MLRFAALLLALSLMVPETSHALPSISTGKASGGATSSGPNSQAKILVHVISVTCKNCCVRGIVSCGPIVTKGTLYPMLYYANLLVVDGETDGSPLSGVGSVQLGIDYDGVSGQGVDIFGWANCTNFNTPTPDWPAAGSGNILTFDPVNNCQKIEPGGAGTGVTASLGLLYMASYTPDRVAVIVHPSDGIARVVDCEGVESIIEGGGVHGTPSPLGFASFSQGAVTPGYNPCGQVIPVENTTWSRIKGLFVEPATRTE